MRGVNWKGSNYAEVEMRGVITVERGGNEGAN